MPASDMLMCLDICIRACHLERPLGRCREEQGKCLSSPRRGSVHAVPALARIKPKNNKERTIHLSPPFLRNFSCIKWQKICYRMRETDEIRKGKAFRTVLCPVGRKPVFVFKVTAWREAVSNSQTELGERAVTQHHPSNILHYKRRVVVWAAFLTGNIHLYSHGNPPWICFHLHCLFNPSPRTLPPFTPADLRSKLLFFVLRCTLETWVDWMCLEGIELALCCQCPASPVSPLRAFLLGRSAS